MEDPYYILCVRIFYGTVVGETLTVQTLAVFLIFLEIFKKSVLIFFVSFDFFLSVLIFFVSFDIFRQFWS